MKNIVAAAAGAVLLVVGLSGCTGLEEAMEQEAANDKPAQVTPGEAFTHDGFEAAKGWKVAKEEFARSATITGLKVTNTGDAGRSALLTFRFYDGKDVLGEVSCSSKEMQVDESSTLDCYSLDSKFPTGYKTVKVSDAF